MARLCRVAFALSECGFHHLQTLIERKPGRDGMPGQHIVLFDGGVEAELERGVPTHLGEHPTTNRLPRSTDVVLTLRSPSIVT